MSLNRYRLKHLVKNKHKGAKLTQALLSRPDRLIGLILIGNNFVNILAASIATIICVRLWGDYGISIATGGLTIIILVFAEITPKTLAAIHPEKIAFPAAFILTPLYKLFSPIIWLVLSLTNGLLRLFGVNTDNVGNDSVNSEELKIIVNEAGALIPKSHQNMLLSILDLEKVTVEDIMIPRAEIIAVEESESACEDFAINLDEFDHVSLYMGPVEKILPELKFQPDCILVDPPRSGLNQKVFDSIKKLTFSYLVYVSCDTATFARDTKRLIAEGFILDEVTPLDMFPQTYHIEQIALFSRR